MIKYKVNVIKMLKDAGYSTYRLRQEKILGEAQLTMLRNDKLVSQDVLNKICTMLQCQPGDLLMHVPDQT